MIPKKLDSAKISEALGYGNTAGIGEILFQVISGYFGSSLSWLIAGCEKELVVLCLAMGVKLVIYDGKKYLKYWVS